MTFREISRLNRTSLFHFSDNSFVAECLDCGLVIRTDNLGENESVQSAHDSMSVEGSCSSRSSSTHSEDHMFKKVSATRFCTYRYKVLHLIQQLWSCRDDISFNNSGHVETVSSLNHTFFSGRLD